MNILKTVEENSLKSKERVITERQKNQDGVIKDRQKNQDENRENHVAKKKNNKEIPRRLIETNDHMYILAFAERSSVT